MTRFIGSVVALTLLAGSARAADAPGPDRRSRQGDQGGLGGEEKLKAAKAFTWSSKGTINFMGDDNAISTVATVQGLDHFRQEFEGEFGGMKVVGVTVLAGTKGWRQFGDNTMELDADAIANDEAAIFYLNVIPVTIPPLGKRRDSRWWPAKKKR